MSRASLIDAYISGLSLTAVSVVASADGRRCRIETGGEIAPCRGERIRRQFFFKPSHADLVLMTIDREGVTDQAPAAVAALIERAAATVAAAYQSPDGLRKAAGQQVDEIVERVKASGQSGRLKRWNAAYKQYRQAQIEKSEPAIPYAHYIERVVTMPTVRQIAATGRTV
jgi:hypothetical protein